MDNGRPNPDIINERLSEMQEKQNLSRFDAVIFLLVPLSTLCISLSVNWIIDPKYFHLGFPVSFALFIVIGATVCVFLPTIVAYLFAYLTDTLTLRIRALKIFFVTCGFWTIVLALPVVGYVPAFVQEYDANLSYQFASIGGILIIVSLMFPYFWLFIQCKLWFRENIPLRFRRESITPWWGDRTDAAKLGIIFLKATTLNGLILMAVGTYFALMIRFTLSEVFMIVGSLMLASCFLMNIRSIISDALFLHKKLKNR